MREVLRVLKPGGRLIIIGEAYKGMRNDKLFQMSIKLLRAAYLSTNEYRELFSAAAIPRSRCLKNPGRAGSAE